jgi:hypothetical protein
MKKLLIPAATLSLLATGGWWLAREQPPAPAADPAPLATAHGALQGLPAVLYKSPTCGCCDGYAEFLANHGASVEVISSDAALARAKRERGVPAHAQSCHTFDLAGYTVEGHVPLAALERLLAERPAIDGVALPGMPVGTPGMPGEQAGPIEVLELDGGVLRPFMTL